ncbi:MAG TPA: NTP transferase domain-containing protein, partial [bacterium]|nr:NTP transferase domain-containing protein [bacterium]
AVCEELLFRGAVLQSLKPVMGRWAVLLTAVLFGVLHLDPWRLVSTVALGVVAGMLVASTGSIAAGMLFHFTNNAIAIVLTTIGSPGAASDAGAPLPWWVMVAASACLPLASWILFGPRRTGITGVVNAGGDGSRLGGAAKPLLRFADGSTVLDRTLGVLRTRCDDVILVANDAAAFQGVEVEIVADRVHDRGAPAGLHAALSAMETPWALVVAGDMPRVDGRVLDALIRRRTVEAQAVVAVVDGRPEPLHALWSREVLPVLEEMLRAGSPSFKDLLARVPHVLVPLEELEREIPGARASFANVNTPADLTAHSLRVA